MRENAIEALFTRLGSEEDDEVTVNIISALKGLPHPKSVRLITAVLDNLETEQPHMLEIAENSMHALAAIGNEEAINVLVKYLNAESPEIQDYATEGLIEVGRPATKSLVSALQSDNPFTRANATRVLAGIGATSAIRSIIPLLDDDDPRVRSEAALALGELGRKV